MITRKRYKYEKDIFGKRHRKYFLENIFGVDVFDMKTFRALKLKLSRDYMAFFGGLNKIYERGEFKRVATESIELTRSTIAILENMIETGTVDKRDVDTIVENINEINTRKEILVEKSTQVKALKTKLDKIHGETGIGPESLKVTESIIRKGARREMKKRREGILPFLRRTAPRSVGLGKEVFGGLGTAVLGPLAPLAQTMGGLGMDLFGLGKGIAQKFGERGEKRISAALRPGIPGPIGEGTGILSRSRMMAGGTTVRRREGSNILLDFFNRGAYKAKWTKELLKRMKTVGAGGKDLASGFLDKVKSFLGSPGKLLGGIAAGVGVGFAASRFIGLGNAISEYKESMDSYRESQERALRVNQMWIEHFQSLTEDMKKDQPKIDVMSKKIEAWKENRENLIDVKDVNTQAFSLPNIELMKQIKKESTEILTDIQKKGAENLPEAQQKRFLELGGRPIPGTSEELLEQVKKLAESVSELSKNVKKDQRVPNIREPGIGNMWDSSDPWVNALASSELDLED